MTALPARLLAFRDAAESTNDDEGNDGRATYVPDSLQTFRQTMEEAAAALSGREAVHQVNWHEDDKNEWTDVSDPSIFNGPSWTHRTLYTTPQGDGVVVLVPREPTETMLEAALRLQGDDAFFAKAPAVLSAFAKIYRAMIAAAPSAKGVANG